MWKQSKKRNSFTTSYWRAMSSNFLESRATACVAVAWEDKLRNYKCPCILSLYPQLFLLNMTPYNTEKSFWSLLLPVPAMSTPNLLPTPSLLTCGRDRVGHKALMLCKPLFSNSYNTGVLSTLFRHKCKAQHCIGCSEES